MQRTLALIPWRSNITLLDKLSDPALRIWYAQKTLQFGVANWERVIHESLPEDLKASLPSLEKEFQDKD